MKKFFKFIGRLLGGLAVLIVLGMAIAAWIYRDIPAEQLEEKYANEASRFMNVAGVRVHYRDEGPQDGPAVVLIHANFASLLGWEPWAEALKDKYRVIRFDMTSHGLTGPDTSGDYTLPRTIEIAEKFIDAMNLDTFSIGGTSLGGTVSIHYTVRHPSRINKLILLSPGSLEGRDQKARRGQVPGFVYFAQRFMPRAAPAFMLRSGFSDDSKLSEALIDQWNDLWKLKGQRVAQLDRLSQYQAGDIEGIIGQVARPVLLLWGEDNQTAHFHQAEEFAKLLKSAPAIDFISYPGVGHMAVQEAGAEIAVDVRNFLDGNLDPNYRLQANAAFAH